MAVRFDEFDEENERERLRKLSDREWAFFVRSGRLVRGIRK